MTTKKRIRPTVAAYFSILEPPVSSWARTLDRTITKHVPGARRKIKWAVPFYYRNGPIAYVSAARRHVGLGLLRGTDLGLKPPWTGTGKTPIMKWIVKKDSDLESPALEAAIQAAAALDAKDPVTWD